MNAPQSMYIDAARSTLPSSANFLSTKAFCEANNIEFVEKTGTTVSEIQAAADVLAAEKVDAVFTPQDNTVMTAELAIYEKFLDAGIPHYTGADSFALNGAFMGYGVNYENLTYEGYGIGGSAVIVKTLTDNKNSRLLRYKRG